MSTAERRESHDTVEYLCRHAAQIRMPEWSAGQRRRSVNDMKESDTARRAFSEHGPWQIDPAALRWRSGIDELRVRAQAEVPERVRRRRVPPLGRFVEAAVLVGGAVAAWGVRERRHGGP